MELETFFLCNPVADQIYDAGFARNVVWDVPLTQGYSHQFLKSRLKQSEQGWLNPNVSLISVWQALRLKNWDAIWVHGYNNAALILVIFYALIRGIPLFFRGESNPTVTAPNLARDILVRQIVKQAHCLFWISSDNRDYYRAFGAQDEQLFFSPYCVDNQFFQSFRTQESESNKKCVFLFASKFIPRKQAGLLVKAYAKLGESDRANSELWLIGDGEQKENLQSVIANLHMQDSVKLLGFKNQTELPIFMNQCHVFVLPSEKEPFGLVINEAMNLAKPIITTNEVGAARDLVQNNSNGWVFPARDREALTASLCEAIRGRRKLKAMGQKSLEQINSWSFKENIEGIKAALHSLDDRYKD